MLLRKNIFIAQVRVPGFCCFGFSRQVSLCNPGLLWTLGTLTPQPPMGAGTTVVIISWLETGCIPGWPWIPNAPESASWAQGTAWRYHRGQLRLMLFVLWLQTQGGINIGKPVATVGAANTDTTSHPPTASCICFLLCVCLCLCASWDWVSLCIKLRLV